MTTRPEGKFLWAARDVGSSVEEMGRGKRDSDLYAGPVKLFSVRLPKRVDWWMDSWPAELWVNWLVSDARCHVIDWFL